MGISVPPQDGFEDALAGPEQGRGALHAQMEIVARPLYGFHILGIELIRNGVSRSGP